MWSWRVIPCFFLASSVIGGIFLAPLLNLPPAKVLWLTILSFLLLIASHWWFKHKKLFTSLIFLKFILLGIYLSGTALYKNNKAHFSNLTLENTLNGIAFVKSANETRAGGIRLVAQLTHCRNDMGEWIPCEGNLLLYTSKSEYEFSYGGIWAIKSTFQEIQGPTNPFAFDYKKYMANQEVFHQAFIKPENLEKLNGFAGSHLKKFAGEIHNWCKATLESQLSNPNEIAVASALLLGNKSLLSEELKESYTDTGATHVLAVSGLHTGIVAGAILLLLQWFNKNNLLWRILKLIIALSVLWLFVLITGMAPSVLRAATMFSFILTGQLLIKRPTNIFNIIALSAFLLICFQPTIVYQIGFQLSYTALIGIVSFQEKIYKTIYLPNKVLQFIWQLISVSLAAQLGTLPLTIYYFHMFPTYFWLSGIIVVPMAGIILKAGMLTLITTWIWEDIAFIPSSILELSIRLMNFGVDMCHQLPGLKSEGLWMDENQTILLTIVIVTFGISWNFFQKKILFISAGCLAFLLADSVIRDAKLVNQQVLTVYDYKDHIIIDYFDGHECICITDFPENTPALTWTTKQNRWFHGIKKCNVMSLGEPIKSNYLIAEANRYLFRNGSVLTLHNEQGVYLNLTSIIDSDGEQLILRNKRKYTSKKDSLDQTWILAEKGAFKHQQYTKTELTAYSKTSN